MKKTEKSVNLTIIWMLLLTFAFLVLIFFAPFIAPLYCDLAGKSETAAKVLLAVFYLCAPGAVAVIISGIRLLLNLKKGEFFTEENTKYLKIMSYSCLYVTPISGVCCYWFYGFFPITASAFFMFLILMVIKNVFEYGSEIKKENDLMI